MTDEDILIARLKERAYDPKRALGLLDRAILIGERQNLIARPAVSHTEIVAAEQALGFRLPSLVRRLYIEVGNGNFGPEYGLHPLQELVANYQLLPDRQPRELVELMEWGCAISSYIDCASHHAPVLRYDPHFENEDIPDPAGHVGGAFLRLEARSLSEWLEAWLDGRLDMEPLLIHQHPRR